MNKFCASTKKLVAKIATTTWVSKIYRKKLVAKIATTTSKCQLLFVLDKLVINPQKGTSLKEPLSKILSSLLVKLNRTTLKVPLTYLQPISFLNSVKINFPSEPVA